jgi:nitrous oxidase accessory protein
MAAGTTPGVTATHQAPVGAAATVLASAAAGDTVLLATGIHRGPLTIGHRVVLRGEPGAILDGGGRGSVITVLASGTAIEALTVRGSGRRVLTIDSGIYVKGAQNVRIVSVRVADVLYGVAAERATGLRIERCTLTGRVSPLHETGEGNGIHLWYTAGAVIDGCDVSRFQDAVYLSFADRTQVTGCRLHDTGRYGLHTMYCQQVELRGNLFTRCVAGCAIMFSNELQVVGNDFAHNRGPRTYGLLLRDCSAGSFRDNRLVANTVAIFLDNSNRNRFHRNLVQDNGWGVILFSSCAGNEFSANDFVQNDYPVSLDMRRTDNRFDDGSAGNYWSDNAPYDLDADGASDVPYSPVSAFSFLSKRFPDLAVLAKSPAVAALTAAERAFPALRPSEAVDRFPRLRPVALARPSSAPPDQGPYWPAAAGFAALATAGGAAIVRRGARRGAAR